MDRYRIIEVKQSVFADNDAAAERLRGELDAQGTYLINLMSSPGYGKTTTLLRLLPLLQRQLRVGVMEADIDSDVDADTVSRTGAKVIQLHTGGMCHLDAAMTREGLRQLGAQGLDDADTGVEHDDREERQVLEGAGDDDEDREHEVDEVEEREQVLEHELLDRLGLELHVDVDATLGDALLDLGVREAAHLVRRLRGRARLLHGSIGLPRHLSSSMCRQRRIAYPQSPRRMPAPRFSRRERGTNTSAFPALVRPVPPRCGGCRAMGRRPPPLRRAGVWV